MSKPFALAYLTSSSAIASGNKSLRDSTATRFMSGFLAIRRSISGRVTENGTALGGVTVTLSGAQHMTATTDAAGNYSFANLWAPGSYTVAASKTHYTFAPQSKTFNGLESQNPYSVWATKGQLMGAYALYEAGSYGEAIIAADSELLWHKETARKEGRSQAK